VRITHVSDGGGARKEGWTGRYCSGAKIDYWGKKELREKTFDFPKGLMNANQ